MNIAPVSNTSFTASLKRESISNFSKNIYIENPTLNQIVKQYDDAIKEIKEQKEKIVEFDKFMRCDTVKEALKKLPEEDSIVIYDRCKGRTIPFDPALVYETSDNRKVELLSKTNNSIKFDTYKENNHIDMTGILNWLSALSEMFN